MSTAVYAVEGLGCESCIAGVLEAVHSLSGVTVVAMDLLTGGQSPLILTSGTKLGTEAVPDAVGVAGFGVTSRGGGDVRGRMDSPSVGEGVSRLGRLQVVSLMEGVS